ncbi:hypothetical protein ACSTD8_22660, partial [Vibrio vulnificus]
NKEAVASSIWLLFFLLECDSKLTHYHPNWLNFNSDNYPARGGTIDSESIVRFFWKLKKEHYPLEQTVHIVLDGAAYHRSEMVRN